MEGVRCIIQGKENWKSEVREKDCQTQQICKTNATKWLVAVVVVVVVVYELLEMQDKNYRT